MISSDEFSELKDPILNISLFIEVMALTIVSLAFSIFLLSVFNLALFYCQRQTFFESIINVCRTKISAGDPVDIEYWHNLQFG